MYALVLSKEVGLGSNVGGTWFICSEDVISDENAGDDLLREQFDWYVR